MRNFKTLLQILPSPTAISFGKREYLFIVQCGLFGSWGLPTCRFQHLPFKGRRKTDGHKNISEAKYTMHNDLGDMAKKIKIKKTEKARSLRLWGVEAAGLQKSPLPDQRRPWHKEGAQAGGTAAVKAKSITRPVGFGMQGFTGYKSREFITEVTQFFLWFGWRSNKWLGCREHQGSAKPTRLSVRTNSAKPRWRAVSDCCTPISHLWALPFRGGFQKTQGSWEAHVVGRGSWIQKNANRATLSNRPPSPF